MPGILLVCPAKRRKRYALICKSRMGTATLCNYLIAHIDSRGIETALLAFMASRSMLIRRSVCILPGSLPPSVKASSPPLLGDRRRYWWHHTDRPACEGALFSVPLLLGTQNGVVASVHTAPVMPDGLVPISDRSNPVASTHRALEKRLDPSTAHSSGLMRNSAMR